MEELSKHFINNNRRHFLKKMGLGIGGLAAASLLDPFSSFGSNNQLNPTGLNLPHFAPKAKRVIYLFQSGGPSQLELFDYKPLLNKRRGEDLPDSVRNGQRLTGIIADSKVAPEQFSVPTN